MAKKKGPQPQNEVGPTQTQMMYDARTDATLSETDKVVRDAFIREYVKDFNATKAATRLGYGNPKTAQSRGSQFLREPYVANKLWDTVRQLQPSDIVSRQEVMAKMWEEANNGRAFPSDRISALAHLGKMLGMYQVQPAEERTAVGVMLIPVSTPEEWAIAAPAAQALLKQKASQNS